MASIFKTRTPLCYIVSLVQEQSCPVLLFFNPNNNDCKADNGEIFQFSYSDGSYGFTAEGEFHPFSSGGGGIDTSDATAYARNIERGYTAYCRGEKIVGTSTIEHELRKLSSVSSLSATKYYHSGASNSSYAIFAGGYGGWNTAEAYSKTLSKSSLDNLSYGRIYIGATGIGNYAIFAGGNGSSGTSGEYFTDTVDVYDNSLSKITVSNLSSKISNLKGCNNGNYALFAGGQVYDRTWKDEIAAKALYIYDTNLTRSYQTISDLGYREYFDTCTNLDQYMLFRYLSKIYVYDSQLTLSYITDLDSYRTVAASNSRYATFVATINGSGYGVNNTDAFDTSLTKSVKSAVSWYGSHSDIAATNAGDYIVYAGGNNGASSGPTYAYDFDLVLRSATGLTNFRRFPTAATIGQYALFTGGLGPQDSTAYNLADAYYSFN